MEIYYQTCKGSPIVIKTLSNNTYLLKELTIVPIPSSYYYHNLLIESLWYCHFPILCYYCMRLISKMDYHREISITMHGYEKFVFYRTLNCILINSPTISFQRVCMFIGHYIQRYMVSHLLKRFCLLYSFSSFLKLKFM